MKRIIILGCFALLTAVGCRKTTNVYYVDPNQPNGNPGNTYSGPINDTILCGSSTCDSSQWAPNAPKKQFEISFTQPDRTAPDFVCYIMDVDDNGGVTLKLENTSDGFKIFIPSTNGTYPWIPQYVTVTIYVVLVHSGNKSTAVKAHTFHKVINTTSSRPLFTQ